MEPLSGAPSGPSGNEPPAAPPAPARQRWRLVLACSGAPPALAGRELSDAFEGGFEAAGLPLVRQPGRQRGRVSFGAPLPAGIAAERELADIVLTELLPQWLVRERITLGLPDGWGLIDLYDVWLSEPALAGQVAAADYRIGIDAPGVPPGAVATAAGALLAADALPRQRQKSGSTVAYDLRPLLLDVAVADPGPPLHVRARTRFHPVLGTGRPEEVVAALGEVLGRPVMAATLVRERLLLADEVTTPA